MEQINKVSPTSKLVQVNGDDYIETLDKANQEYIYTPYKGDASVDEVLAQLRHRGVIV